MRRAADATLRSLLYGQSVARNPAPLDWGVALLGVALTEWVVWYASVGNPVAGARWLVALWPLLLDLPLAWRRIAPLAAAILVCAAVVLQAALTRNSAEGLEVLFALGVAVYSVAAFATRRRAVAGLAAFLAAWGAFTWFDHNVRHGDTGQAWSAAFFGAAFVGIWIAGLAVSGRRETALLAARAAALEREAAAALVDERARMARELHDIVSHNLSVVVLQAAGARASGATESALEKIERSGREALVEMRRLLGVLREDDGPAALAPQPGIGSLPELAARVREAGLPVLLDVNTRELPPALGLAVYRIVQEALTNVLKHAHASGAEVTVRAAEGAVLVKVMDDGVGSPNASGAGHGLAGIRERVALFGGHVEAGPKPGGGFAIHARIPLG
jgi:signal transduction histidine kinase